MIISNHDPNFTRMAYAAAKIEASDVRRSIFRDADTRYSVGELLAIIDN